MSIDDTKYIFVKHILEDPSFEVDRKVDLVRSSLVAQPRLLNEAVDYDGRSLLWHAVHAAIQDRAVVACVGVFLEQGCQTMNTPDRKGVSAFDVAKPALELFSGLFARFNIHAPAVAGSTGPWRVAVRLIEGRNLKIADLNGFSDPYVKMTIGELNFKSACIKKTLNPVWQETFRATVRSHDEMIGIQVWDYDRLSKDDSLGHADVSISHLFLDTPEDRWHPLVDGENGELHLEVTVTQTTLPPQAVAQPVAAPSVVAQTHAPKKERKKFGTAAAEKVKRIVEHMKEPATDVEPYRTTPFGGDFESYSSPFNNLQIDMNNY